MLPGLRLRFSSGCFRGGSMVIQMDFFLQGPSVSAYVTYCRNEDASKAIAAVNNAFIDGRSLK